MESIISVKGLGKSYQIRTGEKKRYHTLRDDLIEAARGFVQGKWGRSQTEEFWALKDINLDIYPGEVVGIIGRNGAGKSTLLKILSRVVQPTTGEAVLHGRIASLLEVGTGFHPELTGRENIFMSGAVLGMQQAEIRRKFDEIVAFAEVEKFLDTPVKRYSSGMYVRLAFAVAAHLEPDILLVDEVLAVGDAAFQKKCLGRMEHVAREGKTVLLVSHSMGLLQELVHRGIWLNEGQLVFDGSVKEAVTSYLSFGNDSDQAAVDLSENRNRLPGMRKILRRAACKTIDGNYARDFTQSEEIIFEVDYFSDGMNLAGIGFNVKTIEGIRIGSFNTYMASPPPHKIPTSGKAVFRFSASQFAPGTYLLTPSLGSHQGSLEDMVENCISFNIHPSDIYGTGYLLSKEDGVSALSVNVQVLTEEAVSP